VKKPMPRQRPLESESSEEGRASFQTRVALFWKVDVLHRSARLWPGCSRAVAKPGVDLLLTLGSTAQAGIFWWLCAGRALHPILSVMEAGGLLINSAIGALLGRYLLAGFRQRSFDCNRRGSSDRRRLRVDAAAERNGDDARIRAALIPSTPRRTIIVTALFGAPMILATPSWCDR